MSIDPAKRQDAARQLGEMRDHMAVPTLAETPKDRNVDVAEAAALALAQIHDEPATSALLKVLHDRRVRIRTRAAVLLVQLHIEEPALPVLRNSLKHRNE